MLINVKKIVFLLCFIKKGLLLLHITIKNNIMSFTNETFLKLLKTIKEEPDCQLNNFAVYMKYGGYEIECYKWYDNQHYEGKDIPLEFDACGSVVFGKYQDITLTDFQYTLLNDVFNAMREKWLKNYETSIAEEHKFYNSDYDVRAEQGLYGYGY